MRKVDKCRDLLNEIGELAHKFAEAYGDAVEEMKEEDDKAGLAEITSVGLAIALFNPAGKHDCVALIGHKTIGLGLVADLSARAADKNSEVSANSFPDLLKELLRHRA